jgi:caffeoyl-CoA O-methyltransferase
MDKLERYIEEYSRVGTEAESALLAELERVTNLQVIQPKMLSGRVQAAFLTLVARMLRPRTVLEIGTFTGYSALAIAAGLDESAEIHTVEIDDELEDLARSFFERSEHGGKIRQHIGAALEVVPGLARELGRPFDLVFIDGDKREYPEYYRMLMGDGGADGRFDGGLAGASAGALVGAPSMLRSGSIILADNVLWYGKVAEPDAVKQADRMSQGIIEFNRIVAEDERVENVILPLRDGVSLVRVK